MSLQCDFALFYCKSSKNLQPVLNVNPHNAHLMNAPEFQGVFFIPLLHFEEQPHIIFLHLKGFGVVGVFFCVAGFK